MLAVSVTRVVASFLLSSLPFLTAFAQQRPENSSESASTRQSVAAFIDAFNRHDGHGVAMSFANDAEFTSVRGATAHGRQQIEAFYAGVFAGRLKNAHRTATVTSVRMLSPTLASVDATWEITGSTTDQGALIPLRRGILTVILAKDTNVWLILVYHELELTPTQ
jgi:uncharacterized protein (TIGR02246 family)